MNTLSFCIVILLLCSTFFAAQRPVPPGIRQANEAESKFEKSMVPAQFSIARNPEQIQRNAAELVKLANSLPTDIQQVNRGILPKDLNEKLKKIEKLSRHLRSELEP